MALNWAWLGNLKQVVVDFVDGRKAPGVALVIEDAAGNPVARGANKKVGTDLTFTWANSAAANTEVSNDIALPDTWQPDARYLIIVRNPSAVTALTGKIKLKATSLGGADRYPRLKGGDFSVSANVPEGEAVLVEGWMLGDGARLTLSNDTALGAADGFSATVRIIQV